MAVKLQPVERNEAYPVLGLGDVHQCARGHSARDVTLLDDRLQNVDRGDFQRIDQTEHVVLQGKVVQIVVDDVADGLGRKIGRLLDVADTAGTSQQVLVDRQAIGGEHVELAATVVDAVDHFEQHLALFAEGLFGLVDEHHTLEAERLQKL